MPDPTNMVWMIAPDGSHAQVPQEHIGDAIKAGAQMGVQMKAPDNSTAIVPPSSVHAAMGAGATMTGEGALAYAQHQAHQSLIQPQQMQTTEQTERAQTPPGQARMMTPGAGGMPVAVPLKTQPGTEAATEQQAAQTQAAAGATGAAVGEMAQNPTRTLVGLATAAAGSKGGEFVGHQLIPPELGKLIANDPDLGKKVGHWVGLISGLFGGSALESKLSKVVLNTIKEHVAETAAQAGATEAVTAAAPAAEKEASRLVLSPEEARAQEILRTARSAAAKPEARTRGMEYAAGRKPLAGLGGSE